MKRTRGLLGFVAFIGFILGLVFFVVLPGADILWQISWTIGLLSLLTLLFRERTSIAYFFFHRTTRYGANLAFTCFCVLAIAAVVAYLGQQHRRRFDLTKNAQHTLSDQSQKILAELPEGIRFQYFFSNSDPAAPAKMVILENYRRSSGKVTVENYDINANPTLAKTFGVNALDTVVVSYASAESSRKPVKVVGVSEEKITNAIMRLMKNQNQTVLFLTGHGERPISNDSDAGGLSMLKQLIEGEVFSVREFAFDKEGKMPEDATVLFVAGPQSLLPDAEFQMIQNWVMKGGKLLLSFDLDLKHEELGPGARQFANWIKGYGVEVGDKLLVDASSRLLKMDGQILISAADSSTHTISKDFPRSSVPTEMVPNFYIPFAVRLKQVEPMPANIDIASIVKTTPQAWEEVSWAEVKSNKVRFDLGKDFRGTMSLGYALDSKKAEAPFRAVVFASSAFFANGTISLKSNRDLVLNSLAWLANQESFIGIRDREPVDTKVSLNSNWINFIYIFIVVALPVVVFIWGLWVWYRRQGR